MEKEFKLDEKIRDLDLKVMNNEISLLVFLNLRNDLDKEFIKKETKLIQLWMREKITAKEFWERRRKLIEGDKLITK